jgi:hypothetical protein
MRARTSPPRARRPPSLGPAATGWVATTPALVVYNGASAGGPRIYLDYLYLLNGGTAFSNSTSNTGMFFAIYIDAGNRFSSGGTGLTPKNVNQDSNQGSYAAINFGAPTATAASGAVRSLVGQRLFRAPVSATALTLANMDDWMFNFGGVEGGPANIVGSSGVLQANISHSVFNLPPVVIGPGKARSSTSGRSRTRARPPATSSRNSGTSSARCQSSGPKLTMTRLT